MATIEDFEILHYCNLLNISGMGWSAPVIQASFGGGYGAGIVANQDYGLHQWLLSSDFLPHKDTFTVTYDLDGEETTDTFFEYIKKFFQRHILLGNKPFVIRDTSNNKFYLVEFTQREITFGRLTAKFFNAESIQISERRHPDLTFNPDGSLDVPIPDDEAPTTISNLSSPSHAHNSLSISFTNPSDNIGVVGYQYRLNGGSWVDFTPSGSSTKTYTITGLTPETEYDIEVRSFDAEPNYSEASNTVTVTTDEVDAPSSLAETSHNSTSASVSFTKSDSSGVTYEYSTDNGSTWHTFSVTGTTTLSGTITGLSPSTAYNIKVRAKYGSAYSDATSAISVTTDAVTLTNYALASAGSTCTNIATSASYPRLINDDLTTNNNYYGGEIFGGAEGSSFEVDFGTNRDITRLDLVGLRNAVNYTTPPTLSETSSFANKDFEWFKWNGSGWDSVAVITGNTLVWNVQTVTMFTASKIKVTVNDTADGNVYIAEIRALG